MTDPIAADLVRRPPPVDGELAVPLARILSSRPSSMTPEMIPGDRARIDAARLTDDDITRNGLFSLEEFTVVPGTPVRVLVARPTNSPGPVPVTYTIHGGGMVAGHNRSAELVGELDRAAELSMAVVSIDYRLAPEHPDPTPVEDCYAGLMWVVENAERLGLDASRIVISGASAGGALAAGVCLLARDRGTPPLLGQLLLCPMTDDRVDTDSTVQMQGLGLWDTTSNVTGWTALLGDKRGGADVSPYAAPARAADLSGLPPAFVDVGSYESLRDEAVEYASRISAAGGHAELHVWGGAFHSFDEWVPEARVSRTARATRTSWVARLLADPTPR